ncbi:hypothetical protein EV182_003267, partial [Spiromyces aspiralis]
MSSDDCPSGDAMGSALRLPLQTPRHLAPNVGGGMASPAAIGWPYFSPLQPGTAGAPWFSGTRIQEFLDDYEVLAERMQYTDREKARRMIDYVASELQDDIRLTVEYEDGDWSGLRDILIEQYDLLDQPCYRQDLDDLTEEKWKLNDVTKKTNRFTYLWRRVYGQDYDGDRKARRYLEALPDELVWAVTDEIYDRSALRSYNEVRKIAIKRATRILNIQRTARRKDSDTKHTATRTTSQQRNTTIDTTPRKHTSADYDKLADQFQKLALQVKELQTESAKATAISKPCLYCDQRGHAKRQCKLLTQDLQAKVVYINQQGRLTNQNGEVYQINTGNGGIRALVTMSATNLVRSEPVQLATNTTTATIHWEEAPVAASGDNATYMSESDVNGMKRQAERQLPRPRKRADEAEAQNPQSTLTDAEQKHKTRILPRTWEEGMSATAVEKILNQPAPLSLKELISLAPAVRRSLHDSTGTHRVPIPGTPSANSRHVSGAMCDRPWQHVLYSCATGAVQGSICGLPVRFSLDAGSELNLMTETVYRQLAERGGIVLRTDLPWRVRDANGGSKPTQAVGVACDIEIGGTRTTAHVFVMTGGEYEVLLGQPWQRLARLKSENRPDGSLWCSIQDAESDQEVTFCAVPSVNKKAYQASGDRLSIEEDEHIVGRVTVEIDPLGVFREGGLLEYTVGTRYKSVKDKVKPATAPLVGVPALTFPKTMESITRKKSMTEERLAVVRIGDGNLREEEVAYIRDRLRPVAETLAVKPTDLGTLSATIEEPVKVHTIPHEAWNDRPYPYPRALEEKILTLLKEKLDLGILEPCQGP